MSKEKTITPSMLIYASNWGEAETFRMIPATLECPYVEAYFDTDYRILTILTKDKEDNLKLVPKLDENGEQAPMKLKRALQQGEQQPMQAKHQVMNLFNRCYIKDPEEIKAFVTMFGVNAEKFSMEKYFVVVPPKKEGVIKSIDELS